MPDGRRAAAGAQRRARPGGQPRDRDGGGGSPGELGGEGLVEALPTADGTRRRGATRDPAADALLSEILPAPPTGRRAQRALPGPQITGLGVLPGPGLGGGGGSGGGSGGGIGRGVGPGTEFFGAREHAGSFAYVIDCSGSMATRNSLEVAKRELLASLDQLPPDAQFGVIFYNLHAFDLDRPPGAAEPDAGDRREQGRWSAGSSARSSPTAGPTTCSALRTALAPAPRGDLLPHRRRPDDQQRRRPRSSREAGTTRIQCIEFGRGVDLGELGPAPPPRRRHRRHVPLHRRASSSPARPAERSGSRGDRGAAGPSRPIAGRVSRLLPSRLRAGCV